MGLIKAGAGALGGALASQWKEFFYADAMPDDVLVTKAQKKTQGRFGGSRMEDENVISSGSVIAVNEGQCMMVVDQGRIVEFSSEPGEYMLKAGTEPSIFDGGLSGEHIREALHTTFDRLSFGGQAGRDQRVYFFNIKEIGANKYGTPNPVPFRVVDENIGLDVDISIKCFGEYSYRMVNPMLFYKNVCGNVQGDYTCAELDSQLKSELLTALGPAFASISAMGIRYSALPGHTALIAGALNDVLSDQWRDLRGIEIVAFGVSSVTASKEDEALIKELQRSAVFRNPNMAAAHLAGAQADAMRSAAENEGGALVGFAGMNMAGQAGGMNAQTLFQIGTQQPKSPQAAQPPSGWACACGHTNQGNFCMECGAAKPAPPSGWKCAVCATTNTGRFCSQCGAKKPVGMRLCQCDKCGWKPDDPTNPPKFCPECGDAFDDADGQ